MLTELEHGSKVVGLNQSRRAISGGRARVVFLAEDASPFIISEIEELCRKNGVELEYVPTMRQLGRACGLSVSSAVAASVKK